MSLSNASAGLPVMLFLFHSPFILQAVAYECGSGCHGVWCCHLALGLLVLALCLLVLEFSVVIMVQSWYTYHPSGN
jgi:NADH:ubiquinone oxidoreductase subunit 3 (subunit A)